MTTRSLLKTVLAAGALAVMGGAVAVQGCGGGSDDCKVGSESCACTAGGACDPGLSCLSNRCVKGGGGTGGAAGGGGGSGGAAGSGGGADGGGMSMANADQICTDFANKLCERFNTCWSFVINIFYGSQSACAMRVKLDCVDGAMAPDSTAVTSGAAAACLQAIPSISCEDILYRKFPAACEFKGTRANGQICGTGDQCQSGYCNTGTMTCGTCSPLATAGSACREDEDCQAGLTCEANRCVVPGAGGTGCSQNQPCKVGFYCRGGSCAAQSTEAGAACTDAESCSFAHGLFCNTTVRVCQKIKVAQAGEPCGIVNNEPIACAAAGTCNLPTATARQGVCAAAAADGAACTPTKECVDPARCVGGLCRLPNARSCN